MDSLLKHVVDMTGHRDHTMLDISVISAVQELSGASQTRVLSIAMVRDQVVLIPRATIRLGQPAQMEANLDGNPAGDPISRFPALAAAIEQNARDAQEAGVDGMHVVWVPMWIKDKANVCLEVTAAQEFTCQSKQVIDGIVSVYRNFQNLLDYSERDALTGLLNRKTFDDQLMKMLLPVMTPEELTLPEAEERRNRSDAEKQWLAVIDVDHFKRVNDQFGHLYGDEVLILIANLMQSTFRAQDRVFRFGGEEFVVLLRSTSYENATKIIDRFRENVEEHVFPQVGQITVSVGFVGISAYESPVVILGHADQALYYAKSHGRNLVCHYDELLAKGLLHIQASNDTADFF